MQSSDDDSSQVEFSWTELQKADRLFARDLNFFFSAQERMEVCLIETLEGVNLENVEIWIV